jgi:hypothetical protein
VRDVATGRSLYGLAASDVNLSAQDAGASVLVSQGAPPVAQLVPAEGGRLQRVACAPPAEASLQSTALALHWGNPTVVPVPGCSSVLRPSALNVLYAWPVAAARRGADPALCDAAAQLLESLGPLGLGRLVVDAVTESPRIAIVAGTPRLRPQRSERDGWEALLSAASREVAQDAVSGSLAWALGVGEGVAHAREELVIR